MAYCERYYNKYWCNSLHAWTHAPRTHCTYKYNNRLRGKRKHVNQKLLRKREYSYRYVYNCTQSTVLRCGTDYIYVERAIQAVHTLRAHICAVLQPLLLLQHAGASALVNMTSSIMPWSSRCYSVTIAIECSTDALQHTSCCLLVTQTASKLL
jgi:hypothetical protein